MKRIKELKPPLVCFGIMTILCGILYTAVMTGVSQLVFPVQANGSMISILQKDGTKKIYGSKLLAQDFKGAEYLIGRPAGVTNLSPVSKEKNPWFRNGLTGGIPLIQTIRQRFQWI